MGFFFNMLLRLLYLSTGTMWNQTNNYTKYRYKVTNSDKYGRT